MLTAVSGFSGSGKGTIMKELLKNYSGYALSVSCTTRSPRPGERHGVEYFFKTDEEFQEMIKNGELIEYAGYVGKYYGTPKKYVEEQLAEGKDVLLEIDVQGALDIKKMYPEVTLIFITAPSFDELKSRLIGRGTETTEAIEQRLKQVEREITCISEYDYIIINNSLKKSVEDIHKIISSQHCKVENNKNFIENFKKGMGGK